jgi:ankyrin repeat protein
MNRSVADDELLSSSSIGCERYVDQMLLSSPICNVNAMDNDQTTPLIMAALQGNAVICESLVRRCSICE